MAARRIPRLLLVDSDALMLDLLRIALKESGCKLLSAADGVEAMQAVEQHRPDLIVTELVLPVMDGLRFLRWLRGSEHAATPVMVLTALDRPGVHDAVTDIGVSALVWKPVTRTELLRHLRKLLRRLPAGMAATG